MKKNRSKILILDNSLKSFLGFRGRLLSELCRTADVEIASVIDVNTYEVPQNVRLHDIKMERGSLSIWNLAQELFRILRILHTNRPTVFVAFTIRCALISGASRFFYRKSKNVAVIAGLGNIFQSTSFKYWIIQKISIYIISKNEKIIVLNKDIFKILKNCKPILIEGEGVDLKKFKFSQKNNINNFIFVGRLLRDKGIFELIEAFNIAKKQYPSIRLKLVLSIDKKNPERIDTSDLLNNIHDGVQIIENCDNVYAQLQEADCFIFPSYHEGFSIALSEAAAVGLILITSNIEGCRQIVTERNGFLIERKSVKSILEAFHKVMALNTNEVKKMSLCSRAIAEQKLDQDLQSKAFYDAIV